MNNITKIFWDLSNHCKSECSYCPVSLRGGDRPNETNEYVRIIKLLIENYSSMNRSIEWIFNGGEPLDMENIVTLLKLCRENGKSMTLNTNGGKLWVDWWAIEPYVDNLILTYHYWQNPALIDFIISIWKKQNKNLSVGVPIRPQFFDYDINRALEIEIKHKLIVGKNILYKFAREDAGMYDYNDQQLRIISGDEYLVEQKIEYDTITWQEKHEELYSTNPVFTGKKCNAGIEYLYISHEGWASGSKCRNHPLGNIWADGWLPPKTSQTCTMQACVDPLDQLITKF